MQSEGLGWLLRPVGAGMFQAQQLTPEVLAALDQRMQQKQLAANVEMLPPDDGVYCGSLTSCGTFSGGCPNLAACTAYT